MPTPVEYYEGTDDTVIQLADYNQMEVEFDYRELSPYLIELDHRLSKEITDSNAKSFLNPVNEKTFDKILSDLNKCVAKFIKIGADKKICDSVLIHINEIKKLYQGFNQPKEENQPRFAVGQIVDQMKDKLREISSKLNLNSPEPLKVKELQVLFLHT